MAKLKEIGHALATYENISAGVLPPVRWHPAAEDLDFDLYDDGPYGRSDVEYGWMEILFHYIYREPVRVPHDYPVQRNIQGHRWQEYFLCEAVGDKGVNSGHYRAYLPVWSIGTYALGADGVYADTTIANPYRPASRDRIPPKLPLIGDANDLSERGDGLGDDDCSYIDAGEANYAGSNGRTNGNRFSDRHYGGTNFLFQDLHANWSTRLRGELARDYDLNGVADIEVMP
jgi:prepilin-type processing-associated H-X9-DG protein